MPQVDPKFTFWFGVWTSLLTLIAGYGIDHAPALVAQYAPTVQWFAAMIAQINGVILTALVGISSSKPGPLVSVPGGAVKPVVILALVLGAFLAASGDARAQATKKFVPTGNLVDDVKAATTPDKPKLITGNIEKDAHAIWDKIVSASNADLKYASALAGVANTPASLVRKQCYDAILELNTQVNGMNLRDDQGNPLPQPDPKLFTGVEQAAETIDNLSPSGKLFTSCAGMAQLTKTNVLTLINAIVTGAAGFAAMPVIPGL